MAAKRPKKAGGQSTKPGIAKQVIGETIEIRGARQNNLQNVNVSFPRNRLVAITGVSGSGKSSLAFDTLFREGQRRFLETLSAYARQFLGNMEKPDVDYIEGLSPAIAVDQRAIQRGPRSTVGTITEVVDYLRVLYARAGVAHCPEHQTPLVSQTPEAIRLQIQEAFADQPVHVMAPLIRDRKGSHQALFQDLQRKGFVRVRVDGKLLRLEEVPELARYKRHRIDVVIDRLKINAEAQSRLREAVDAALDLGKGDLVVLGIEEEQAYSAQRSCKLCGREAPPLEPRLFSFNSPHGACVDCEGLGVLKRPSERLLVPDPSLSIRQGCLGVTRAAGGSLSIPRASFEFLDKVAEAHGFSLDTPWEELERAHQNVILNGAGEQRFADKSSWNGKRYQGSVSWQRRWKGVLGSLQEALKKGGRRKQVERFMATRPCKSCGGSRLNEYATAVTVGGISISEVIHTPVGDLRVRLGEFKLSKRETKIAEGLLKEIERRIGFLNDVGLSYLTLDRAADTLSGGEAQRIRLAAQLGAGLQGVTYVLDEPSIGLHPRDHGRLFGALCLLRDAGNTVVVVEHDEATLRAADWLIDIGPGAGSQGGRLMASGPPSEVAASDSPTGKLLRGELPMPVPEQRRVGNGKQLSIVGATGFNLKGVDVSIPLGTLTVISGVSGSGKSTLIHHTLFRAVTRHLGLEAPQPEDVKRIEGLEHVEDLVFLSSAPIGRTPRSNPATYSGAFTPIRELYANLPEAKMRGWGASRFSFNVEGGRCEVCQGAGARFVELQFLAPVTVPCEECGGHRFQHETLEVRYREKSIADVLAMTIVEAQELFADHPKINRPLDALCEVGLGYLTLGQPSTTISGGEAQRVKLAKQLQKRSRKHTLYLLDEPTTGLHHQDVQMLVAALQRLVDQDNSVIVIEHMLEVIRAGDYVIDLGPEGGIGGGALVIAGTPEEVEACSFSHTGEALRQDKESQSRVLEAVQGGTHAEPRDTILIEGARTHNLKNINLEIPRNALTVITGPSGSGKSSLALDTIHATGRQRFVESLSTYARQFLSSSSTAPVDRIEGLGPSVAVEARTSRGHPRSTVATTTEIHDHLRVLWARAGTRRCPEHGEILVRSDAGSVTRRMLKELEGQKGWIVAPIFGPGLEEPDDLPKAFQSASGAWLAAGYVRALVDGAELRLARDVELPEGAQCVDVVMDRLGFLKTSSARIAEAIESAEALSGGRVSVVLRGKGKHNKRIAYSTRGVCTQCDFTLAEELEPRHFSFNTHVGACPACHGLGQRWQCDAELLVDTPHLPLINNEPGGKTAVGGKLGRYLTKGKAYYENLLRTVAKAHRIDINKPFMELSDAAKALLLHGVGARATYQINIDKEGSTFEMHESFRGEWPGLCGHVNAWHAKAEDAEWRTTLEAFMSERPCSGCQGERLAPGPRAVSLGKKRLPEVLAMSVTEAQVWLQGIKLSALAREAVEPLLLELCSRIELLGEVGLGYLTLDRSTSTLSGGEARRVRLSASLGSQLVGVCYVLDEPTVGLHPRDIDQLTSALLHLRDGGNTVIVVEHDESLMRRADYLVDMGPGAGRLGGQIAAMGTPAEVQAKGNSMTAKALRGELSLPKRAGSAHAARGERLKITGAKLHNLKNVSYEAEFGALNGICGPSGSGKSTLIMECLVPALQGERAAGRWKSVRGSVGGSRRVVLVDSSPIGRTPKSVPATAVGLMEHLRDLFSRTPEARMRGLRPFSFSFNSTAGRCPACEGRGFSKVEMQFLANLWLLCEECEGRRYKPEILEVLYRGRSIADLLAMSVEEALEFLEHVPNCRTILDTLKDVGLGYMTLGQSSTTLSVGEAQRVKLATELCRAEDSARSIIILDEPTTGLAKSDVTYLYAVLRRLAQRGNAVLVIEHHTDLLLACDRLVEMGPEGGHAGGRVIAEGTPEELMANPDSITGPWMASSLAAHRPKQRARAKKQTKPAASAGKKLVRSRTKNSDGEAL